MHRPTSSTCLTHRRLLPFHARHSHAVRNMNDSGPLESNSRPISGLPGDFGFDPLCIYSSGVIMPSWLQYSEVYHSRWAMIAVVGCLIPDMRGEIEWFKASYRLHAIQMVLSLGPLEYLRIKAFLEPKSKTPSDDLPQGYEWLKESLSSCATGDPIYPGGPLFNPIQLLRDKGSSNLSKLKDTELIVGRLAMVAFLGFIVQGLATEEGPYQNLLSHLNNPIGENVVTLLAEKNAVAIKTVEERMAGIGVGFPDVDGMSRMEYKARLLEDLYGSGLE